MNWSIEGDELTVVHAEGEDEKAKPDKGLVTYAKQATEKLAEKLGGKDHHIEVRGHETTEGRGFKPGHITISVSRLDPQAKKGK